MKTLDLKTLRDDGYLQEVNRCFFHPLGLALTITIDGESASLSIQDAREDLEGFRFPPGNDDLTEKAARLMVIADARREARMRGLGYWRQPFSDSPAGRLEMDVDASATLADLEARFDDIGKLASKITDVLRRPRFIWIGNEGFMGVSVELERLQREREARCDHQFMRCSICGKVEIKEIVGNARG